MLRPFLVLGLGGSGGKTLQVLKASLLLQLRQAGWTGEELPLAWQLLQIDVPPVSTEFHADLPDPLKGDEYLGLASPGVTFDAIDKAFVSRLRSNKLAREATAGWKPRADFVTVPIERGAGQYRAIGRLLTVYHLASINTAVESAITRMEGLDSIAELQRVAQLLGVDASGNPDSPVALVVSSIAGGTGAGMFMDVCDVLRMTGRSWCNESYAILYTPDVFDELNEQSRLGVRPNALGSMAEILAGFWDQDGFSDDEQALLRLFAGLNLPDGVARVGPRFPFLVGRSNGKITFEHQNDSYRSMGRALSAWVTSPVIQGAMGNYVSGNWVTSSGLPDALPFKATGQEQPFQAMGFARLSMGRDRFEQYVSERLARSAIDRLLAGHMENLPVTETRSADQVKAAVVDQVQEEFFRSSGLDFGTETVQEILGQEGIRRLHQGITDELIRSVFSSDASLSVGEIARSSRNLIGNFAREWEPRFRSHYQQQLQRWVQSIQPQTLDFALDQAAVRGLPVTIDLLRRLSDRMLNNGLVARIRDDQARNKQQALVEPVITQDIDKSVAPDSPEASQIVGQAARTFTRQMVAESLGAFAELLEDFERNFLTPLTYSLEAANVQLKHRSTERRPELWPKRTDTSVPDRHKPTPNEQVLLKHTSFDAGMRALLKQQFERSQEGSSIDAETAIDRGIAAVVTQSQPGSPYSRQILDAGRKWVPEQPELRPDKNAASAAPLVATIDLQPDVLFQRSRDVVTEPQTPMGRYLRESIADYLSERNPADHLAPRLQQLRGALSEAMRAADPLVAISPNALNAIHQMGRMTTMRIFSGMPFPEGAQARQVAEGVLGDFGMTEMERRPAFTSAASSNQFVDIFTMLSTPVEAAVIDSLMEPVRAEWDRAASSGEQAIDDFWRFRRTRPLPQAIAMAPSVRQSMVRGWFTAQVLGQIDENIDRLNGQGELKVFAPNGASGGKYLRLPVPMLISTRAGRGDRIAGVLKSASLAMLQANKGDLEAVGAYERLRDLGRSGSGDPRLYTELNPELREWIEFGTLPDGAPHPQAAWAGTPTGDWTDRRNALAAQFEKLIANYQQHVFAPVDKLEHLDQAPRAWELRSDYLKALESLRAAVVMFEVEPDVDL